MVKTPEHSTAVVSEPIVGVSRMEDPQVLAAVEEYLAAQQAGQRLDREGSRARHADVAEALAACLEGLDFIQGAARQFSTPALPGVDSTELQPESPLGDFRIVREVGRGGMGVVY